MAIGDEENDISMIEFAGIGEAMKMQSQQLRKLLMALIDNDHDGVAIVIENLR